MGKRKNECLFCTSRKCSTRIVSTEDNGKIYDEVACSKHSADLHKHSDAAAPKIMKLFMSSTGALKRGEDINSELEELKKQPRAAESEVADNVKTEAT